MHRSYRTVFGVVCCLLWLHAMPLHAQPLNQLLNGSFEASSTVLNTPDSWSREAFIASAASMTLDSDVARQGMNSIRIASAIPNDATWIQTITLKPNHTYLLSGWVRTESVSHTADAVDLGANLCLFGTWDHTAGLNGTNDWTSLRMVFNSGSSGVVTVGARLGYWAGTVTGTAWFDDLRVTEIRADDPHPRWKLLTLIYEHTDFTYTDSTGTHHVVGHIDPAQVASAAANATLFANVDIPSLDSGNMIPELTIRYPGVLRNLSSDGYDHLGVSGWWPSSDDTAADRDPAFDSVIVIWQPVVTDQATGQSLELPSFAGLTAWTGTGQTYMTMIVDGATLWGHRNVFKHEYGHSLLFFYEAAGTAPVPAVSNHTDVSTYVHCGGRPYDPSLWLDETTAQPVPGSIYNNRSGFTHDYYSGTTALATTPQSCLGITPTAWATGGPVSLPGEPKAPAPAEALRNLRTSLEKLVDSGVLRRSWSRPLEEHLEQAMWAMRHDDIRTVKQSLRSFRDKVLALRDKGRLPVSAATMLLAQADAILTSLPSVHEHGSDHDDPPSR